MTSRSMIMRLRPTVIRRMGIRRSWLGVTALLVCGLFSSVAYGWYSPGWAYRQEITILPTLADSNLSGFPYLVKITDGANPVFANALANGDDIVFTSSDGSTKLAHELEKYDSTTNELFAWVRVPTISSTADTVIYMYYGNGSVTASEEDVEGTWDSDFVDVQHLQETAGTHFDSTSNNNDATPLNGVNQNATGQIDGANQFDGSNDKVDTPDSASLRVVDMTVEAWVYVPSSIPAGFDGIVVHAPSTSNWYGLWKNSNRFHFRWSTGSVRRTDFNATFSANQWYYVAGVLDVGADQVRTYQNDTLDTTINGPSAPTPAAGPLYIGHTFGSSEFFPGFIDEVRISRVARSDAWIKASARNQGTPDTYQTLGSEESDSCVISTTVDSLTPGSLRACIVAANTNPGADTINVPAGTYNLTLDDDLLITEQLTINGAGQATTIVDGQALDRVFDIDPGITVNMSGLTIRNGDIGGGDGGGIRNRGSLTLTNVIVRDSAAAKGGGIHSDGAATALTFNNVTITDNSADNGAGIYHKNAGASLTMTGGSITNNTTGGSGGGIYNERGDVTLTGVTVSGNVAKVGGGVWNKEVEATLDITNSTFSQNTTVSEDGGAIRNEKGTITIDNSTFDNNTGARDGGALHSVKAESNVTITDSTFSSNQTGTEDGGAIYFEAAGTLTINRATFNGNDAGRDGGAIWLKDAIATLTNVTVSGNSATGDDGGGIFAEKGTVRLDNVTLTGNSASSGGGIFVASNPVILFNTIVANSPSGGNCSGSITSLGTNLDSANTCALTGPGDLINSNPSLGSLQNNGGPTQTHALFGSSAAINTANNTGCPTTDQRGVGRPIDGTCDIGAYEAPAGAPGPSVCQVDPSGTYIEAENFTGTIVQGATFAVESSTPGFNGSGYLRATGGSTSSPPVNEGKIYTIDFTTSGTYNVWMRGYGLSGSSDSAFIGLNGTSVGALNDSGTYNTWVWSNGIQTGTNQITVAAGFQDFNTWIREANHRIDGFYLTQGVETPTGGIPAGVPTLDPTQCGNANLALTKSDAPDPVSTGSAFTYNMLVINNGPVAATNVTLVDTLPATVDWQLATPSQGSCVHSGEPLGGTVTCTLGTIANGAGATVDIEVNAPGTSGVLNNSASVSADEPDPDASDNTATEDTTVIDPIAALSVTVVEDYDPAGVNLPFVYNVTVTNAGPVHATLVTLVDTLDSAVSFQTAVPSQGSCAESLGVVTCDLGDLDNGSIATIDITVTAPATPQTVTNTAMVSAAEPDPDFSDNTWDEDTDVVDPAPADLELTKVDTPDPVLAGNPLTYALTINNLGPGPATLVQLTDTLPAGVIFVSATPSSGSCSESGGTVDCALGTIVSGASETVDIIVTPPAVPGLITNSASVSAVQSDPDPGNNSASADTVVVVVGEADLSLSKADSPDPVLVNQALSYSLVVDNLGPDDAIDVVLVDTLPPTATFQSAISSQGSCSEAGGTVTCNLGMIANAAGATVDIIVTAPPSAGTITNNASVSTSYDDLYPANDNASTITTVENLNVNQLCYLVADAGGGNGGNDLLTRIDTADFDPLTNETSIGTGTGTNRIEAIAWNSSTGVLYGADAGRLGVLSTTTGVFTALPSAFGTGSGAFGNITFNDVDGLAYDATTGVLYGSERQSGTDVLIQINMATGAHVPNAFGAGIDYVPLPPISGNSITDDIAVDPTTGILYAAVNAGGSTDRLIRVNKATGATTDVALITVPDIEGLGTDPTGQLWGTSGTQRILYELNKVTGVGSNGRPINNGSDYESVDCYAFSPSVVADLNVSKIVNNASPVEGSTITYTVTVANAGPSAAATVVQITDVLPAGVTFVSAVPSQGTYDNVTGQWFVGTVAAGSNATLNIQATVDAGTAATTITNTASVAYLSQNDPDAGNDSDSVDIVPVPAVANLLVLKSSSVVRDPLGEVAPNAFAIPGAVVEYTISTSNSGNSDATSIVVTDTLTSELSFLAGEYNGGASDIAITVGAAAPVYCIAEVDGDSNADGCFLNAAGDLLTVSIPVSGGYPTGLTIGTTAPNNVALVRFRVTIN